jgi:hypothetical protein
MLERALVVMGGVFVILAGALLIVAASGVEREPAANQSAVPTANPGASAGNYALPQRNPAEPLSPESLSKNKI